MKLSELKDTHRKKAKSKRVGRGIGSGKGKTCGRGCKGAKSRSGYKTRTGTEGGQLPLYRKLPIRGFSRGRFLLDTFELNLSMIDKFFAEGETVNLHSLREKGFISNKKDPRIKILGNGELSKAMKFEIHAISASAQEKVSNAKGEVKILG